MCVCVFDGKKQIQELSPTVPCLFELQHVSHLVNIMCYKYCCLLSNGFLFTIGDEPVLTSLPQHAINKIMGPGQYSDSTTKALLKEAIEFEQRNRRRK